MSDWKGPQGPPQAAGAERSPEKRDPLPPEAKAGGHAHLPYSLQRKIVSDVLAHHWGIKKAADCSAASIHKISIY
jgi:hypothetical protein